MYDAELTMKLRKHALEGKEWALDMLIAGAEVSALQGAVESMHKRFDTAVERAKSIHDGETLKLKPAEG